MSGIAGSFASVAPRPTSRAADQVGVQLEGSCHEQHCLARWSRGHRSVRPRLFGIEIGHPVHVLVARWLVNDRDQNDLGRDSHRLSQEAK